MAKTSINNLKQWFLTNLFPTQQQFWNWLDSYRHLDVKVPIEDVEGLQEALDGKADSVAMAKIKIDGVWFDTEGNVDRFAIEVGNPFEGWNGDTFIVGIVTALPFDITDDSTYKTAIKNKAL